MGRFTSSLRMFSFLLLLLQICSCAAQGKTDIAGPRKCDSGKYSSTGHEPGCANCRAACDVTNGEREISTCTTTTNRVCASPTCSCSNGAAATGKTCFLATNKDNTCSSCDGGYHKSISGTTCVAYEGSCSHGRLITQALRTHMNHCGTCDDGYNLVWTRTKRRSCVSYDTRNKQRTRKLLITRGYDSKPRIGPRDRVRPRKLLSREQPRRAFHACSKRCKHRRRKAYNCPNGKPVDGQHSGATTRCNACNGNFYYHSGTNRCQPCMEHDQQTTPGPPYRCKPGYYENKNACYGGDILANTGGTAYQTYSPTGWSGYNGWTTPPSETDRVCTSCSESVASLASCTACSAAGAGGCTAGTCATGFHTFAAFKWHG